MIFSWAAGAVKSRQFFVVPLGKRSWEVVE